jgi:hypothetical protein
MAAVDDLTELVERAAAAETSALASKWKDEPDVQSQIRRTRMAAEEQRQAVRLDTDPALLSPRWAGLRQNYLDLGAQLALPGQEPSVQGHPDDGDGDSVPRRLSHQAAAQAELDAVAAVGVARMALTDAALAVLQARLARIQAGEDQPDSVAMSVALAQCDSSAVFPNPDGAQTNVTLSSAALVALAQRGQQPWARQEQIRQCGHSDLGRRNRQHPRRRRRIRQRAARVDDQAPPYGNCQRPVTRAGQHCWQHTGSSRAAPRQLPFGYPTPSPWVPAPRPDPSSQPPRRPQPVPPKGFAPPLRCPPVPHLLTSIDREA